MEMVPRRQQSVCSLFVVTKWRRLLSLNVLDQVQDLLPCVGLHSSADASLSYQKKALSHLRKAKVPYIATGPERPQMETRSRCCCKWKAGSLSADYDLVG